MNAKPIRDKSTFGATLNAVIIYDAFDFAAKANAMLERAAHWTDESKHWRLNWSVKPWRADILKMPPAAEAALEEAKGAHLILLAVRESQSFAPSVLDWLERWAKCRQVQDAALALWDGGNAATGSAKAMPELSQFAGRHGLSLIFNGNAPVGERSLTVASALDKHEASFPTTLQHSPEEPTRDDGGPSRIGQQ